MTKQRPKTVIFREGKNVVLSPLERRHVSARYQQWLNDPVVCRDNSHAVFQYSTDQMKAYVASAKATSGFHAFAIHLKSSGEHVGNITLGNISWVNRSAEIAILIGERKAWGKGIGFEACQLVLQYAFDSLNLRRVYMGMTVRNRAMVRIAQKLGMRQEGLFREALYKEGKYLDVIQFSKLNQRRR